MYVCMYVCMYVFILSIHHYMYIHTYLSSKALRTIHTYTSSVIYPSIYPSIHQQQAICNLPGVEARDLGPAHHCLTHLSTYPSIHTSTTGYLQSPRGRSKGLRASYHCLAAFSLFSQTDFPFLCHANLE